MWCIGTKKSDEVDIVREHVQHLIKLQTMKSFINTNPPKQVLHLRKKPKKSATHSGSLVQLENQILLKKMYEIDSRPINMARLPQSSSFKSLNRNSRIKNLTKISEENQGLLTRLQRTKSSYSTKAWDKEHEFKSYLKNKLSQNSRRIPRIASFTMTGGFGLSNTSFSKSGAGFERPNTSQKLKL